MLRKERLRGRDFIITNSARARELALCWRENVIVVVNPIRGLARISEMSRKCRNVECRIIHRQPKLNLVDNRRLLT